MDIKKFKKEMSERTPEQVEKSKKHGQEDVDRRVDMARKMLGKKHKKAGLSGIKYVK